LLTAAWLPPGGRRCRCSWIGLTAVAGAGVLLGRVLLRYVRLSVVRYIGAGVCAILGVVTVISALAA
jgi:hypothetical protein